MARVSHGAARASLFVNARSVTAYVADHSPMPHNSVSPVVGTIFPIVVTVIALVLTIRSLNRGEIA